MEDKDWIPGYEFEPLAPVEAPTNWIGGLLTVAVLFFAYWIVG